MNPGKTTEFTYRLAARLYQHSQRQPSEVFRALHTSLEGLSNEMVISRQLLYGPNEVAGKSKSSALAILVKAFRNPFNYLISTLAIVSYLTDDMRATVVMFAMIVLSVALTFIQELRSSRAAESLSAMVQTNVSVTRNSVKVDIPLLDLVPGDLVHLSAGDLVPADLRLVSSKTVMVNQSAITGETMPVEKDAEAETGFTHQQLPELRSICFMGSSVASGIATAVVLHTGQRTYLGSIAKNILGSKVETSFDQGIARYTRLMLYFMGVMVPLVFLINGITKGNWSEAFLFAVAIAVGLTPEMLPMIVTVNLAKGAMAMSKKRVIVKRLSAIQNFGAMNILCTDKTGTLTEDELVFGGAFDSYGHEDQNALYYAYLNSFFQTGLKNFLDIALIDHYEKIVPSAHHGISALDELPFDFSRRRMSVLISDPTGKHTLICKGAVEEVILRSSQVLKNGVRQALTPSDLDDCFKAAQTLSDRGFRAVAVAIKEFSGTEKKCELSDEQNLTLVGYVGFLDPPVKESSALAIKALSDYGVTVKILTGDNERVTANVAKNVGLPFDKILLGHQIALMSESDLQSEAEKTTIFAKLTPDQKQRVIRALQSAGHVVGFIGDGINDAPALKAADVGISVNNAVDIAKESADIILLEKDLLVLEQGVIEGRKVFGNIVKYIKMGSSSNFGNVFSMLGASCFLPFLPMLPVQLLTQNLLYDFSQTAIPFDRVDEEYLQKPRKWEIDGIRKFMFFFGPVSSIFDYATFAVMWFYFKANHPEAQSMFQSGWFIEGLLSQTLIVHLIRTRKIPFLQSTASRALIFTTLAVMAAGICLPFSSFGHALGFVSLPLTYFPWLFGILIFYCILAQWVKTWFIDRYGFQ